MNFNILATVENIFIPKVLRHNDLRPESTFSTHVHCKLKECKLVINKDSDFNIVSPKLVKELNLQPESISYPFEIFGLNHSLTLVCRFSKI